MIYVEAVAVFCFKIISKLCIVLYTHENLCLLTRITRRARTLVRIERSQRTGTTVQTRFSIARVRNGYFTEGSTET